MVGRITSDADFKAEQVPPNLAKLGRDLCQFFGVSPNHFGCKGDPAHRGGYHRSRQFLLRSPHARDRRYSVSDDPANLAGNPDWCSGFDLTLPTSKLLPACRRLDAAVRAGKLPKLAEWYGNLGDDQRVDGWDNIRRRVATADDSHMWHLHCGILRKHANDDHSDLYAVLTGEAPPMTPEDYVKLLRDPTVRTEFGNIVKEARFGFDLTKDGKGFTVGGALVDLLRRPAAGAPAAGVGIDAGAIADAVVRKGLALLTQLTNATPPK